MEINVNRSWLYGVRPADDPTYRRRLAQGRYGFWRKEWRFHLHFTHDENRITDALRMMEVWQQRYLEAAAEEVERVRHQ